MTDQEDLEAKALAAFEAGEFVRYRELLQQADRWPPLLPVSPREIRTIALGDHAAMAAMLERNALRGSAMALSMLVSEAYEDGQPDRVREWCESAARFGDPELMKTLGFLADDVSDHAVARWCFEEAAKAGDDEAVFLVGSVAFSAGDLDTARAWIEQSAALGNDFSMNWLGLSWLDEDDTERARAWFEQAAALGNGDAMCNLALLHRGLRDEAETQAWLDRGADIGHAGATLLRYAWNPDRQAEYALLIRDRVAGSLDLEDLGGALAEGSFGDVAVYIEDVLWMTSAALADAGDPQAAQRHREIARARYEARTADGDDEAMLNLGKLLIEDGDDETGRAWLEQAAGLGNEEAKETLRELGG